MLLFYYSRPAFAPIYANQYSHSSSTSAAAAASQWSANHHQFTSNQFHSVSSTGVSGGVAGASSALKRDVDSSGNGSSRKEKRQYKKRKHKTQQRDKPYPSPGTKMIDFYVLLQFIYKKKLLGPAADSFMHLASSDEDEPLSAGSGIAAVAGGSVIGGPISPSGGNGLGQESTEDEGLYQFRRSKATHYHRVSCILNKLLIAISITYNIYVFESSQPLTQDVGNWPWTSTDENGSADIKYRFTLTSLRHERLVGCH